jgi:MoxR-like ATPase
MATIKLRIPDTEEPLILPLSGEAALLIGRDPNPARLDPVLLEELRGVAIQTVKVPSLRVSANHLLLQRMGAVVKVSDLHSRNGTWLRLLPLRTLTLPGEVDLTCDLAGLTSGSMSLVGPREAEWTTEAEYPAAVVTALSDWLQRSGMPARVFSTLSGHEHDEDEDAVPLPDGSRLHVMPPRHATFEVPWRMLIDRVRDYVNEQNIRFEQLQGHDEDFILVSPIMREVHHQIVDAAAYGMRLMILGPTGAGKERLARCFHKHSRQHRGPYATVNCALLKENLLYAQLFGAKKGSYTGAVQDVVGVVEAAHEGTLFLDEIGEMDLEVQKALLRFLDSRGEYQRLGDTHVRRANVQIVCATNVPLDGPLERRGKFRDDLWYRLAVKVVQVPPLRERREDILAFLKSRLLRGGQIRASDALSPAALQLVLQDPWPGNFRDLENFVDRLPPNVGPGALDERLCSAALSEGRGPISTGGKSSGTFRSLPPPQPGDWPEISSVAYSAFEEDHGGAPKNWGQLQIYMEKYFKPVFIAQSCGLGEIQELSKNINYSELARRLNIADGTTVKMHLSRYIERFRKRAPATDP